MSLSVGSMFIMWHNLIGSWLVSTDSSSSSSSKVAEWGGINGGSEMVDAE